MRLYVLLCVGFLCALASPASAGIINGDFATGDFTGWQTDQDVAGFSIVSVGGENKASIEFTDPTQPSLLMMQQTFTVDGTTPQLFSVDYSYNLLNTADMDVLVGIVANPLQFDNSYSGRPENPTVVSVPTTTFSGILNPGTYTFVAQLDRDFPVAFNPTGQLLIGNVQLSAVPEPATVSLLLCGALGAVLVVRATKRHASR